ncbi:MAG: DoxX family protein [Deltaproteobacteria bacterium]|nr:DoxX family protein [Deltaproteobacteria bacterium]
MDFVKAREAEVYAALRIVTGFLFQWHGMQKVFDFPQPMPEGMPAFIIWVAGPLEIFGGLLVMVGFLTRPVAFVLSGLMASAYWMGHGTKALLPSMNGGELAALYCFLFLFISARGSGIWSLDGGD